MDECRVLTEKDRALIEPLFRLFYTKLDDIAQLYTPELIIQTRDLYTFDYFRAQLAPGAEKRLRTHFKNSRLDGILIESFGSIGLFDTTRIDWVMTANSGSGTGSKLIKDSIERALERKDWVEIAASSLNQGAITQYQRLGFVINPLKYHYLMVFMDYTINHNLARKLD